MNKTAELIIRLVITVLVTYIIMGLIVQTIRLLWNMLAITLVWLDCDRKGSWFSWIIKYMPMAEGGFFNYQNLRQYAKYESGSTNSNSYYYSSTASDPYTTVGVREGMSYEDMRRVYRTKARATHPDMGGDADEFKRLAEAWEEIQRREKVDA